MFKKLLVLPLVFCFMVSPTHANTDGLKLAFQELNYALSVEWDQKDLKFKEEQMKKFEQEVLKLGLSNQELMDFAISEVKDESLKRDLKTSFSMIQINKMSSREAKKYVQDTLEKSLSKGASWNGSISEQWLVGIIALAVILVLASRPSDPEEEVLLGEQPDGSFCGYTEVCEYQRNPHPLADFDDYGYYCSDEYYCVK